MPSLLLPLVQMSSKCEYAILKENSSDPTEKSSMVSDFNSNFDSNLSQCNAANDVYSSISYENQGGFQLLDLIITELKSHMTC